METKTTVRLLEISNVILELIDSRDFEEMPRGDLQAVIEAQVMSAYYIGNKKNKYTFTREEIVNRHLSEDAKYLTEEQANLVKDLLSKK